MPVDIKISQKRITAYLSDEIDHHYATKMRQKIDLAIHENHPQLLILDFGGVTFMDSSGIGLVMGRYRLIKEYGGNIRVENAPQHIARVMKLSGVDKLCQSSQEKKEVCIGENH